MICKYRKVWGQDTFASLAQNSTLSINFSSSARETSRLILLAQPAAGGWIGGFAKAHSTNCEKSFKSRLSKWILMLCCVFPFAFTCTFWFNWLPAPQSSGWGFYYCFTRHIFLHFLFQPPLESVWARIRFRNAPGVSHDEVRAEETWVDTEPWGPYVSFLIFKNSSAPLAEYFFVEVRGEIIFIKTRDSPMWLCRKNRPIRSIRHFA